MFHSQPPGGRSRHWPALRQVPGPCFSSPETIAQNNCKTLTEAERQGEGEKKSHGILLNQREGDVVY